MWLINLPFCQLDLCYNIDCGRVLSFNSILTDKYYFFLFFLSPSSAFLYCVCPAMSTLTQFLGKCRYSPLGIFWFVPHPIPLQSLRSNGKRKRQQHLFLPVVLTSCNSRFHSGGVNRDGDELADCRVNRNLQCVSLI